MDIIKEMGGTRKQIPSSKKVKVGLPKAVCLGSKFHYSTHCLVHVWYEIVHSYKKKSHLSTIIASSLYAVPLSCQRRQRKLFWVDPLYCFARAERVHVHVRVYLSACPKITARPTRAHYLHWYGEKITSVYSCASAFSTKISRSHNFLLP